MGHDRTGFYTDGRSTRSPMHARVSPFPPLCLLDKVRLAATILYASRLRDWQALETIPVSDG